MKALLVTVALVCMLLGVWLFLARHPDRVAPPFTRADPNGIDKRGLNARELDRVTILVTKIVPAPEAFP